jgi:ABC-type siderophore export system fused ATPase/permease subunit
MDMRVEYTKNNTKVYDSYKYSNKEIEQAVQTIIDTRKELGLPVTRTKQSYISEWKSHNRLYKLGIQRHRTKDVDLEEEINSIRNFLYLILGF